MNPVFLDIQSEVYEVLVLLVQIDLESMKTEINQGIAVHL